MSEELSEGMLKAIAEAKAATDGFRAAPCLLTAKRLEDALALCRETALFDSMTRRTKDTPTP